jgi:ribosomal protein L29
MIKPTEKTKLKSTGPAELSKKLVKLTQDLVQERQQLRLGKATNSEAGKKIRYQIALIKTLLREHQLTKLDKKDQGSK